ncbi:hypothetical protein Mal48_06330 [Thalassoglobus polymorphus]|uniref:Uncharacterized protein n=1 Tax=Thalassoglobus polymorphus TaxID=2527994 RepID=A0A517QIE0_9PLAN|nr:hypothetical protein Mal48_06330 [Thalassoglobus polymorphus]
MTRPPPREERVSLESIMKLEIALSEVEKSSYFRGIRTDSNRRAVRHEAESQHQFDRCSYCK